MKNLGLWSLSLLLSVFLLLLFFVGCESGEEEQCACVTKSLVHGSTCYETCSQGAQCEWTNDVGGRFCECAASQDDCVGTCPKCQ